MRIVGVYSFNKGQRAVEQEYPHLYKEVVDMIASVNADDHKTKSSQEKTMPGRMLFNPKSLNRSFTSIFLAKGWQKQKVPCIYPTQFYVEGYTPPPTARGAFREIDFVKEKLGVEIQFGKYAFMVYNVCSKMTIFNKLGLIDTGIEIVPVKGFADYMPTGVSYFEQFVWDLENRGIANIDIPVLVLGVDR